MSDPRTAAAPAEQAPTVTAPVRLALAWGLVGVPLAWGVYQTFVKSLALFR
jgi:hypothetical protein